MFAAVAINLYKIFKGIFPYLKHFQVEGFAQISLAAIKAQSLKVSELARCYKGDMSYKSKRNKVERFLENTRITTSLLQRQYIAYLFDYFQLSKNKKVEIIVDYTDFIGYKILYAGIPVKSRIFPIYFKIFSKKRRYSTKRIETMFLRTLAIELPREYKYIIVADRGLGNEPFIDLCERLNYSYVLRVKGSLFVKQGEKSRKISDLTTKGNRNIDYKGHKVNLVISEENNQIWYLFTNLKELRTVAKIYKRRFWTEEFFRDIKTYFKSGKLKYKMDKLKRLLFIGQICYNFIFEIGIKERFDTDFYSASKLSFFPKSLLSYSIFLQEIS